MTLISISNLDNSNCCQPSRTSKLIVAMRLTDFANCHVSQDRSRTIFLHSGSQLTYCVHRQISYGPCLGWQYPPGKGGLGGLLSRP